MTKSKLKSNRKSECDTIEGEGTIRRKKKKETYDNVPDRAPWADNSTCRYRRARGRTCLAN